MTQKARAIESRKGEQAINEDRAIRLWPWLDHNPKAARNWDMSLQQPQWILDAHNTHTGRIFIVGSGPSLRGQLDTLRHLEGEYVWSVNRLSHWEDFPVTPSHHSVTEPGPIGGWGKYVLPEYDYPAVKNRIAVHWVPVTAPGWLWVAKAPDEIQIRWEGFFGLGDHLPPLPSGWASPLTSCQVAAWLGFTEFYFLGIDNTQEGQAWDPIYGRTARPRSIISVEESFDRACHQIEKAGRRIVDCTPGGGINKRGILPYEPLEAVLGIE